MYENFHFFFQVSKAIMDNVEKIKEKVMASKPERKGVVRPKRQYHLTSDKVLEDLQQKEDEKMEIEERRTRKREVREDLKRIQDHERYMKQYTKEIGGKIVTDEATAAKRAKKIQDLKEIIQPKKSLAPIPSPIPSTRTSPQPSPTTTTTKPITTNKDNIKATKKPPKKQQQQPTGSIVCSE